MQNRKNRTNGYIFLLNGLIGFSLFQSFFIVGCTVTLDRARVYSLDGEARRYFVIGVEHSKNNRRNEAIEAYTRSIKASPSSAAYNNRSHEYIKKKLYDSALTDINKAIYMSPRYDRAYFNRGAIYYEKRDYHKALKDFSQAVYLSPEKADYYYHLAQTYEKLQLHREALDMYKKSIEKDSNYYLTYYRLACVFSQKKEKELALQYLEDSVKRGFSDLNALRNDESLNNIRGTDGFIRILNDLEGRNN